MRKSIERFLFLSACCSLLGMLPVCSAHAQDTGSTILNSEVAPSVNVAIASHFTPPVSAPSRSTMSLSPIDPLRPRFGSCGGPGGSCLELGTPSFIFEGGVRHDPACNIEHPCGP